MLSCSPVSFFKFRSFQVRIKCFNFSERKHFKNICSSLSLDISPFSIFLIKATFQILPPTSFLSFTNQSAVTNSHHFNPGQTLCFKTPIYHLSQGSEFTQAFPQAQCTELRALCCPCPVGSFHRRRCRNVEITKRKIWCLMFFPYHFLAALYLLLKCMVNENIKCFTDFLT